MRPDLTRKTFPRSARVRTSAEYTRVFNLARRTASPQLALHFSAGGETARLGLAVSRKVDKRAVGRNRIKRTLREYFRQLRNCLPNGDYVLVARPAAAQISSAQLCSVLNGLLKRAGALPVLDADGTMGVSALKPSLSSSVPDKKTG